MLRTFFILIFVYNLSNLSAQKIEIVEDSLIVKMTKAYIDANKRVKIDGWRIQILSTTDRKKMEETLEIAKAKYPEFYIDWVHNKPYYKINVGAFLKKAEAQSKLSKVRQAFPNSYIMQDKIKPKELL
jgi:hypothetical protein